MRSPTLDVVLLHPFGGSARTWTEVIELLVGYRCHALDLPGFGNSEEPAADVGGMADWVERVLPSSPYILVGHSMGGKVAMALAMRRPAGLRYLVLLAPSPPTPEPISREDRKRMIESFGKQKEIESMVARITGKPLPPHIFARTVEDYLRTSPDAWAAWLEHGSREDISASLGEIEVLSTVLSGSEDSTIPTHVVEREVATRLTTTITLVHGAGHLLPIEAPVEVAAAVSEINGPLGAPPLLHGSR